MNQQTTPTLNVIIKELPLIEVREVASFDSRINFLPELITDYDKAGFLINVNPKCFYSDGIKNYEITGTTKYYLEVSDRRIMVRENNRIGIQIITELLLFAIAHNRVLAAIELDKLGINYIIPYYGYGSLIPFVTQYMKAEKIFRDLR